MDCLIIDLNGLCADPIAISQSGGQLSSGKRASCCIIFTFQVRSHQDPYCGFAAGPQFSNLKTQFFPFRRGTVQLKSQCSRLKHTHGQP